jgi:hypothetical protein
MILGVSPEDVDLQRNQDAFIRRIEECLADSNLTLRARRVALAWENSWPHRISEVLNALQAQPFMGKRAGK